LVQQWCASYVSVAKPQPPCNKTTGECRPLFKGHGGSRCTQLENLGSKERVEANKVGLNMSQRAWNASSHCALWIFKATWTHVRLCGSSPACRKLAGFLDRPRISGHILDRSDLGNLRLTGVRAQNPLLDPCGVTTLELGDTHKQRWVNSFMQGSLRIDSRLNAQFSQAPRRCHRTGASWWTQAQRRWVLPKHCRGSDTGYMVLRS
jgi:uncharacterized protein YecT (DUF1311 family)